MPRPPRSAPVWPWALAASGVTFLAFLPTLANGWVNWDDDLNFLSNPAYRGLGLAQLRWMLTTFHLGPWQPLSWLTLGVDFTLWGMDARGYHLTSLLLHAANAAIFVYLAAALFKEDRRAALFAALFFAVHPLRVESVAWVTERRDVLSGLFFLLFLLFYVRRRNGAAFAAFLLSLAAKATGVTAPLVLLVLDICPLNRLPADPRRWLDRACRPVLVEKIPYFAAALVVGVLALIGQSQAGAFRAVAPMGLIPRLGLTSLASTFYLWKTAWPAGLSPLYELKPGFDPFGPVVMASVAALVVITLGLVLLARRSAAPLAAWIAYLVMIFPLSGIARTGHQFAADRYTYLACVPLALLCGAGLARWGRRARPVAALIVIGLAALTFVQTRVWRDSISLWTRALAVDPTSDVAAINLASGLVEVERYREAEKVYRDLLARNPGHDDARYNLGTTLYLEERIPEAEAVFESLVREKPDFPGGHYGLALVRKYQGRIDEARAAVRETLRLKPDFRMARELLARLDQESR